MDKAEFLAGPHEPELLEQPESLLAQARELRAFLINRAESRDDSTEVHTAYCYTLKCAVESLLHGFEMQIDWQQQDRNDAPMLREQVAKLQRDLELAQQPLTEQMERLNQRVIELTAAIDAKVTGAQQ